MPRHNQRKKRRLGDGVPTSWKPKGRKRPRGWHRGQEEDRLYAAAETRLAQ